MTGEEDEYLNPLLRQSRSMKKPIMKDETLVAKRMLAQGPEAIAKDLCEKKELLKQ
jgi:hypothetical protein